jgi:hypothetical protein
MLLTKYFTNNIYENTNWLTPRSSALRENPLVVQLLKSLSTFYGTWRYITSFTRVLNSKLHKVDKKETFYRDQSIRTSIAFVTSLSPASSTKILINKVVQNIYVVTDWDGKKGEANNMRIKSIVCIRLPTEIVSTSTHGASNVHQFLSTSAQFKETLLNTELGLQLGDSFIMKFHFQRAHDIYRKDASGSVHVRPVLHATSVSSR